MTRIGIDARLNAYRVGGIPQYTLQLLTALAPLAPSDTLVSLQHATHPQPLVALPNVRRATLFTPPHHRLEPWSLPLELVPRRLDVLHCPDVIAPRWRCCPVVVTIHDLAFLHYPDILDTSAHRYYGQVRDSVWRADAVIAVSQATRQDISTLLGFPPERVDVVAEAAAPLFSPLPPEPGASRSFTRFPPQWTSQDRGTPCSLQADTFVLFVSTLEPRKNVPTLLHALRVCLDRRPDVPYRLVVAGARGWRDEAIFATVRDLRLGDAVVFVGKVSQEQLCWLYRACRIYVNPSRYEGFGLPVAEALACGAPSLVAATSSLPEVAGEAALLLPPLEVDAWAEALERLWHDDDLRSTLARRGPLQASRFSWEQAARQTLQIYRRVARNP
ncbi:MAG: glycosyltransferase family 4 protein [Chloroflexaceae bacterium]|nr:glycosyltransferase family 4 protein [Chloroflexaceae bacterium]